MVEIRPVLTKKDLRLFIMLPFRLYKNDPNWVAPLISDQWKFFNPVQNGYYRHSKVALFLACENGRVVGRISAQTNTQHNLEHKDKVGFFGFFECEDNQAAADALFRIASEWNKAEGMDTLRGPMNFSVNEECGLLVDGFDTPPYLMMTHHLPYYEKLFTTAGFVKAKDLYAYLYNVTALPEKIDKAAQYAMKRNKITVRTLSKNKKQMKQDINTVFQIYRQAWQYNWGAVPLTDGELEHLVDTLLPLVDPDLVLIAEADGVPAGFSLAMPNYNEVLKVMNGRTNPLTMIRAFIKSRHIRTARVITMGVIKEYHNRGIDLVMHYYSFKNGIPKGYKQAELSWVLEDNEKMIREAELFGAKIYKTYRIFDKAIV
jgi:hypothetical protein